VQGSFLDAGHALRLRDRQVTRIDVTLA
jgi:hypothetical protein